MVAPSISPSTSVVIELEGHIIDSLTLARVMDLIQQAGAEYQLHVLTIGDVKTTPSRAVMTIFTKGAQGLSQLVEALKPFGAKILTEQSVILSEKNKNEGFTVHLPQAVLVNDRWIPIKLEPQQAGNCADWVIAVNEVQTEAFLKPKNQVGDNEWVVSSHHGLQWG